MVSTRVRRVLPVPLALSQRERKLWSALRATFIVTAMATSTTLTRKGAARHGRFPHPGPLPEGEGEMERAARDFHLKTSSSGGWSLKKA